MQECVGFSTDSAAAAQQRLHPTAVGAQPEGIEGSGMRPPRVSHMTLGKATGKAVAFATFASSMSSPCFGKHQTAYRSRHAPRDACRHCSVFAARLAACAVCLSLRAVFRVCHDLLSVFGFGCNFLCEARIFGAAMYAPSS